MGNLCQPRYNWQSFWPDPGLMPGSPGDRWIRPPGGKTQFTPFLSRHPFTAMPPLLPAREITVRRCDAMLCCCLHPSGGLSRHHRLDPITDRRSPARPTRVDSRSSRSSDPQYYYFPLLTGRRTDGRRPDEIVHRPSAREQSRSGQDVDRPVRCPGKEKADSLPVSLKWRLSQLPGEVSDDCTVTAHK